MQILEKKTKNVHENVLVNTGKGNTWESLTAVIYIYMTLAVKVASNPNTLSTKLKLVAVNYDVLLYT